MQQSHKNIQKKINNQLKMAQSGSDIYKRTILNVRVYKAERF